MLLHWSHHVYYAAYFLSCLLTAFPGPNVVVTIIKDKPYHAIPCRYFSPAFVDLVSFNSNAPGAF